MEQHIRVASGDIDLEADLRASRTGKGVVVTHPHPFYGGNMDNPVVMAAADAFWDKGYSVLRFNFRGTGKSGGRFDDGNGEQADVIAAVSFLRVKGLREIALAGYSFGSWVNCRALDRLPDIARHIMISPPVAMLDFDSVSSLPAETLIVTGSEDTIAPYSLIKSHAAEWNPEPRLRVIEHCDHFYGNALDELESVISSFI